MVFMKLTPGSKDGSKSQNLSSHTEQQNFKEAKYEEEYLTISLLKSDTLSIVSSFLKSKMPKQTMITLRGMAEHRFSSVYRAPLLWKGMAAMPKNF